jgi:hypothetical protein
MILETIDAGPEFGGAIVAWSNGGDFKADVSRMLDAMHQGFLAVPDHRACVSQATFDAFVQQLVSTGYADEQAQIRLSEVFRVVVLPAPERIGANEK